jgi:hypothetical protein
MSNTPVDLTFTTPALEETTLNLGDAPINVPRPQASLFSLENFVNVEGNIPTLVAPIPLVTCLPKHLIQPLSHLHLN